MNKIMDTIMFNITNTQVTLDGYLSSKSKMKNVDIIKYLEGQIDGMKWCLKILIKGV